MDIELKYKFKYCMWYMTGENYHQILPTYLRLNVMFNFLIDIVVVIMLKFLEARSMGHVMRQIIFKEIGFKSF